MMDAALARQYVNTLLRQGFAGGVMDCPLSVAVEGTVGHFVTECVVLENVREQLGVPQEDALEETVI